jgi:hypothetical protein
MISAYISVQLWKQGVLKINNIDLNYVRQAIYDMQINSPKGLV